MSQSKQILDGHSWTVTDYEEIDGHLYKVDYLFVIDGDRVLKKIIKKERMYRRDIKFAEEVT
jgi:hypothetical protein